MISVVAQDFFQRSPVLVFPLIALVIFMGIFTAVSLRTLIKGKRHFERYARMPLEDGESTSHE